MGQCRISNSLSGTSQKAIFYWILKRWECLRARNVRYGANGDGEVLQYLKEFLESRFPCMVG